MNEMKNNGINLLIFIIGNILQFKLYVYKKIKIFLKGNNEIHFASDI
jgi:hypothetical protein